MKLTVDIEPPAGDNRKNAIQYILLHELAHTVAIGGDLHPSWNAPPKALESPAAYPFFNLSWRLAPDRASYVTRFEAQFPQRKAVVYYAGPKLSARRMPEIYDVLERTKFATLYSVVNPFDDFAEAFTTYVHTVVMHKPFAIRIYENGQLVKTYRACWDQPRCAAKRKILEALLEDRAPS